MAEVRMLFHATTIATNAAITRGGAKTGLITTRGFRDILELHRFDCVSAQGERQASGTSYSAVSQRTGHKRRRRRVRFLTSDEPVETDVIDRSTIRPGETLRGPLIVEQIDSTIMIPPNMRAVCESTGDITIKVSS